MPTALYFTARLPLLGHHSRDGYHDNTQLLSLSKRMRGARLVLLQQLTLRRGHY